MSFSGDWLTREHEATDGQTCGAAAVSRVYLVLLIGCFQAAEVLKVWAWGVHSVPLACIET